MKTLSLATLMLMVLALGIAHAQITDGQPRDKDPFFLRPGETEVIYRQPDEVPRQLRELLRGCHYEHWLADFPIRVFRPGPQARLIALAPCGVIVNYGVAFRIDRTWQPQPIEFVVAAAPGGLMNVRTPGYLEWHSDTGTLTATRVSDVCPHTETRHSYRHNGSESPFTLIKIESRAGCGDPVAPWTVLFEAGDWGQPK